MMEDYKDEFISHIEYFAITYKLIGTSLYESPMWFQFREVKDNAMMFVSSQRNGMWFSIKLKEEDAELLKRKSFDGIYEYFKGVKYDYLKEVHPTVYSQIK
jgi:hypothetical protein